MPESLQSPTLRCANRECGVEFSPRKPWQKFHSPECRRRFWRARQQPRSPARPARKRQRARRRGRLYLILSLPV